MVFKIMRVRSEVGMASMVIIGVVLEFGDGYG